MGCTSLQLKLLSLQGDKSTCTIQQLCIQEQEPGPLSSLAAIASASADTSSQPQAAADAQAGADAGASVPSALPVPRQQAVSQLDELRLLLQQLHQPGKQEMLLKSLTV